MNTSREYSSKTKKYLNNRKVRILDTVFTIKFKDGLKSGGYTDIADGEILISNDIKSKYEIRRIIIHELGHALMNGLSDHQSHREVCKTGNTLKIEEYMVEFFSRGLAILYEENKEFLNVILKAE